MTEQKNIHIVQQLLAALRRGDIPGVLDKLADDVQWRAWGPAERLPSLEPLYGKVQVGKFLAELEGREFQRIEPQEFVVQGEQVLVLGQANYPSRSKGQPTRLDWVMVFELCNNKIVSYQYCDDTLVAGVRNQ
jgi:ketosteroid isomerase-like protein